MWKAQKGKCAICRIIIPDPFVDHCWVSRLVRGLLCRKCNSGLGWFEDDPLKLRAAAEYVESLPYAVPYIGGKRTGKNHAAHKADREILKAYALHVLDEQSIMHRDGLRMPTLLKLLSAAWPTDATSQRPSEATFRRSLKDMLAEGLLDLMEKSKGRGDLLKIRGVTRIEEEVAA
jgi:hypothetical protein